MIKIHATKKLLTKLPITDDGFLATEKPLHEPDNCDTAQQSPLSGWHANLISLQGHDNVLFVHDTTRFAVLVKALDKADFARLDWHFQDGFMNTLLKSDLPPALMERATPHLSALCFDTDCNRSVQGTMNLMAGNLAHMLDFDGIGLSELSAYRASAWLSDRPCNIKGQKDCVWPIKAMGELLANLSNVDTPSTGEKPPENVVNLKDYR